MAESAVIPFDHKGAAKAELPAHLAAVFGEDGNITPRITINQLSYRGKTFRRVVDGEEVAITKLDPDTQDRVPVQVVNVVILDHNKSRSRAYYEGEYEEGKNASPKCFSGDGVKPDESVTEPVCATCAQCPKAVKGSKTTPQGKAVTACAPYKRVAVVPTASLLTQGGHVPLLLRLAQTSVWDKDNPNEGEGWYAWDQYLDMLRARGAKHTAAVETRIKFDLAVAYPKLLFSAARWMNPDEAAAIKIKLEADKDAIAGILNGKQSEDGVTGQPAAGTAASTPSPAVDAAAEAAKVAAAQAAATKAAEAEATRVAAAKAAEAQKAADVKAAQLAELQRQMAALQGGDGAAPAATVVDDGFGGGGAPAVETKPAATTTKPTAPAAEVIETGTPGGLSALLQNWDA